MGQVAALAAWATSQQVKFGGPDLYPRPHLDTKILSPGARVNLCCLW
jgi:hypothetical protein